MLQMSVEHDGEYTDVGNSGGHSEMSYSDLPTGADDVFGFVDNVDDTEILEGKNIMYIH